MKKLLSKVLSVLVFISIVLPSTNIVFAAGEVSTIDVVNNAGMPDTVKVTGLEVGDTVTVYSIVQPELIPNFNSGISSGLQQISQPGLPIYELTPRSTPLGYRCLATDSVTFAPIYAIPETLQTTSTIYKPGIQAKMVYGTVTVIGTAKAKADKVLKGTAPTVSATVNVEFPFASGSVYGYDTDPLGNKILRKAGSVYVSVTRNGMHESIPTEVEYPAEQRTPKEYVKIETPINNAGIPDTVKVTGLEVGDIVKVYAKPLSSVEAPTSTEPVIITTGLLTGSLSEQLMATYNIANSKYLYRRKCAGEGQDVGQFLNLINYSNAFDLLTYKYTHGLLDLAGRADTLTKASKADPGNSTLEAAAASYLKDAVTQVRAFYVEIAAFETNDNFLVKDASVGALLGTGTAKADKVTKGTTPTVSATVSIPQLVSDGGAIFVSVTRKTFLESDKIGKVPSDKTVGTSYGPEIATTMPSSMVTIVNNAIIPDTVKVENLKVGDIVNVYLADQYGNITSISKGNATAKANKVVKGSIATATATVSIPQLLKAGGYICVTVTSKALLESAPSQAIKFKEEGQTQPPEIKTQL
ncbi:hypothetical protein [Clostridium tagluense]|uniref:hypothetical protein n=1 Tax=Clostridium tagluense TaxID=360422 RepID=UPI001CF37E00|nr:hypothetical protein [Clostridium tagluense]MCB2297174.1 hypothetical protein [Clostridium tagluense]